MTIAFETAIGILKIDEEDGMITGISEGVMPIASSSPLLLKAEEEVLEYLRKERKSFSVPIQIREGTDFQKKAWMAIASIPYGKTVSYSDLADMIGTSAVRAAASATGKNPIPIIIPCHRVIRKSGDIGQFSLFGQDAKRYLLSLEGALL